MPHRQRKIIFISQENPSRVALVVIKTSGLSFGEFSWHEFSILVGSNLTNLIFKERRNFQSFFHFLFLARKGSR